MAKKKRKKKKGRKPETVDVYVDDHFDITPANIRVESFDVVRYHAPRKHDVRLHFSDPALFGRESVTIKKGKNVRLKVFPLGKVFSTFAHYTDVKLKGGGGNEGKTRVGGGG